MSNSDEMHDEQAMNLRAEEQAQAGRRGSWLRPNSSSWPGRWLLCEIGYRLVVLGAWLEGAFPAIDDPRKDQAG